ncbi:hypothetical protein VCE7224_00262 [Vibrio celticus]|uniref:Uncharacterized protein n=1 Tax=Vibrio celticus TaxID=446372 RepID=A0A1C3J918_9VIBR|nr:hypothetical protein VCE7224_00262 [Vibrio celticus]
MKVISIFVKTTGFLIKKIFFLLIEAISLTYMIFHINKAIGEIIFYGMKLIFTKHQHKRLISRAHKITMRKD